MRNPRSRVQDGWPSHRCQQCRLFLADCLCAEIPTLPTRTRLLVLLHEKEDRKTTNTGRLAARSLPNSEVVVRGGLDASRTFPLPLPSWAEHGDPVLLFPEPDARPLSEWAFHPRPVTLIVPDGTWRQAKKVRRRVEWLHGVPCASITRDAPSRYRLRHTGDPRRLSTLEAIAEALAILEGDAGIDIRAALLRIFDAMVERTLRMRYPGAALPKAPTPAS